MSAPSPSAPVLIQPSSAADPMAPVLGLVGGGQLAKMTAQAAAQLGCSVAILERREHSPASGLAHHLFVGDWDQPASLLKLAAVSDVLTLENEFVDAEALASVERHGHVLRPGSGTIKIVQDKLWQKQALADEGVPLARFADTPTRADVVRAAGDWGWPVVLKTRRNGYDGKGNCTVRSEAGLESAWQALGGDRNALFVEAWFPFERELAVMVTRSVRGESVVYPVVETVQHDHICHVVKAPASVPASLADQATAIARQAVTAVGAVGTFGVELFLAADGSLAVNELAPRVHNSGHYTIEACECSQFENHVRAVFGWPLGSPRLRVPGAAMVNLLGAGPGSGRPDGFDEAMSVPGAAIHLYGKTTSARGRKMGHVTAVGPDPETALATARQAASRLRFGNPA